MGGFVATGVGVALLAVVVCVPAAQDAAWAVRSSPTGFATSGAASVAPAGKCPVSSRHVVHLGGSEDRGNPKPVPVSLPVWGRVTVEAHWGQSALTAPKASNSRILRRLCVSRRDHGAHVRATFRAVGIGHSQVETGKPFGPTAGMEFTARVEVHAKHGS